MFEVEIRTEYGLNLLCLLSAEIRKENKNCYIGGEDIHPFDQNGHFSAIFKWSRTSNSPAKGPNFYPSNEITERHSEAIKNQIMKTAHNIFGPFAAISCSETHQRYQCHISHITLDQCCRWQVPYGGTQRSSQVVLETIATN